GTMGAGIAVACLRAGLPVTLLEADDAALARGRDNVAKNLDGYVSRGRMSEDAKAGLMEKLAGTVDYAALGEADLVIEAVFEDLDVKKQVFARLGAAAKPGAVLATNTSYLDINQIAAATRRPEDVIGLHFFAPAHIMRLLEIVRADKTAPEVIATGFALARKLGKVGVLAGVCDGFIGNRILAHFRKQADYMVEDGALPWEIDAAMEAFGFPMGPFKVMDLSGLDISWAMRKRLAPTRPAEERYVEIADRVCEAGWLGRKTGRGWYLYEGGKARPNPEVEAIVLEESAKKGIVRRSFGAEEIQDRILSAMINEGARIVEEGIAQRPLDVDVVEIMGYGFPRWRGGPMCAGDIIGLDRVLASIRAYGEEDAYYWRPAALLDRLVAEGKTFADLNGA
ncbi:MAG: 3-hydroxyacyl-CoA dehydrogenase NAD-binding domain-containing protein, partial [Alphaproteobacteria bacterium]|nr:3-hydroxyacyl-CoA dehydrogenase NAD-binding domain-containing protein [Alphaproteobacteria bacterium]